MAYYPETNTLKTETESSDLWYR